MIICVNKQNTNTENKKHNNHIKVANMNQNVNTNKYTNEVEEDGEQNNTNES